jgi:hypothetical protein
MPKRIAIMWCSLVLFLLSCLSAGATPYGIVPAGSPSSGTTLEPSSTVTGTPTVTVTPSPTATDTRTATATASPTPLPMPNLRLAFFADGGLWSVEPPSEPILALSHDSDPVRNYHPNTMMLSGDGGQITFIGYDLLSSIDTVDFHGSNVRTLLTTEQVNHLLPPQEWIDHLGLWFGDWIPGTPRMLFSLRVWGLQSGWSPSDDLFWLDVGTGALIHLLENNDGGYPTASPDGGMIALAKCRSVSLASINGKILYPDIVETASEYSGCTTPDIVWATDSSGFGMLVPSNDSVIFYAIDASTGDASPPVLLPRDFNGVLSPSLDCVADSVPFEEPPLGFPRLVPFEETDSLKHLVMGSAQFLSFSPDGKYYAFSGKGSGGTPTLYIGDLDQRIVSISAISEPWIIKWVNNRQFVFRISDTLRLGDVGGNSSVIAELSQMSPYFDALDLDFPL